jgi:aspartate aminotransferase-like enzyme
MVAVNIVSSPYGGFFGEWLARQGARVQEVRAEPGRPITIEAVKQALEALPDVDLVAMVHAETSSGILNPLEQIAPLVKAKGALLVVDAVASFAGHALDVDGLGIDVCVTGPQKSAGGPAGLSVATISAAAWQAVAAAGAPSPSNLSLGDLKANWLDKGRGVVPGMPSAVEFWALEAAIDALEAEGLANRIARHELAGKASRAGVSALGLAPWVEDGRQASNLATAAPVPRGTDPDRLIAAAGRFGAVLTAGFGEVRDRLLRLDHTGARANFPNVLTNVIGYGLALRGLGQPVDLGAAAEAVANAYSERAVRSGR